MAKEKVPWLGRIVSSTQAVQPLQRYPNGSVVESRLKSCPGWHQPSKSGTRLRGHRTDGALLRERELMQISRRPPQRR
jgi:hypothetical protein